ncbi:hypothetical protein, partial [Dialister hominis]|uniref:hypothetical protein n=1 Tax=Dialister hominis TaxID=2582419 RepID=UPI003FD7E51C
CIFCMVLQCTESMAEMAEGDIFRYGLPAGCAAESVPRELYILLLLRKIWKILDEYRKSPITIHTGVTVRTGKISGSP